LNFWIGFNLKIQDFWEAGTHRMVNGY